MKHKHHIIPKHMGGTNDISNLIELSVEEHATAHRILYENYGKWQDYIAWQGLSGRMNKEEIIREKIKLGNIGKKLSNETKKKIGLSSAGRLHTDEAKIKMSILATGKKPSEETRQKLRDSHLGKKPSNETKLKMSLALKGVKRPQEVIDKIKKELPEIFDDQHVCLFIDHVLDVAEKALLGWDNKKYLIQSNKN